MEKTPQNIPSPGSDPQDGMDMGLERSRSLGDKNQTAVKLAPTYR